MKENKQKKINFVKSISTITMTKYFTRYGVDRHNFNKGYIRDEILELVIEDIKRDLQKKLEDAKELDGKEGKNNEK